MHKRGCTLKNKPNTYIQYPILFYTQFSEYNKMHDKPMREENGTQNQGKQTIEADLQIGKSPKLAGKDFNTIVNSMLNKEKDGYTL